MTSHDFAALAHIRILVIPVGPIPRSTFEKYAAEIRTFDSIRLGDIPSGMKDERGMSICFCIQRRYFMDHISPFHAKPTFKWLSVS